MGEDRKDGGMGDLKGPLEHVLASDEDGDSDEAMQHTGVSYFGAKLRVTLWAYGVEERGKARSRDGGNEEHDSHCVPALSLPWDVEWDRGRAEKARVSSKTTRNRKEC